ncbi:alpha/beta hydrolase [Paenibacillus hexagrammi]|uniref:Alpha/beta hydrolase n=1 Tax=Paenibacillus hexagrammi TaxID=2908839 RepID=A0ABY3SNT0_9BACL|nr:alpha/beta hydrolase [Paenibacillus sp. YPD9-1]UJF34756.1 alpha/beta hydrolase [Paenibacillus sp. YPD9-1]
MKLEILTYVPDGIASETPLLFVHGGSHGAWCWKEHFLPYFSSKGFPSYALSLRGHGESEGNEQIHSFSLNDYMNDVLEVMQLMNKKPVLIGHSLGGAIVQKIICSHPDKIQGAVLMASIPPNGMSRDIRRLLFTRFKELYQIRLFDKGRSPHMPSRAFLSPDLPDEKREEYLGLLKPESTKAQHESMRRFVPKSVSTKVPMLVMGSRQDWFFPEKTVHSIGKNYNTEPVIFNDISHDMMLDPKWRTVADQIVPFLQKLAP